MTMTREELQRLYDDCQDGRYGHLVALVDGVRRFLGEPDPTVEIAYLKAALADVEAERDGAKVAELERSAESMIAIAKERFAEAEGLGEKGHGPNYQRGLAYEQAALWLRARAAAIESGAES